MLITVPRARPDGIYEMVIDHLTVIGLVWLCVDRRQYADANRLGRRFAEYLRLPEDPDGPSTSTPRAALTQPAEERRHTLARLQQDASGSLGTPVSRPPGRRAGGPHADAARAHRRLAQRDPGAGRRLTERGSTQPHSVSPWPAQVTAIPSMPLDPSKAGRPCAVAIRVSVPSGATA